MKLKSLLALSFSLALLSLSCRKEPVAPGGDSGSVADGDNAYVVVSIAPPTRSSSSASAGSSAAAAVSYDEKTVKHAKVFVVVDDKIMKIIDIGGGGKSDVYVTTPGYKYFYAVVNMPADLFKDVAVGSSWKSSVESNPALNRRLLSDMAAFQTELLGGADGQGGFWMSNFYEVPVIMPHELKALADGSVQTVSIDVSPMVAKVSPVVSDNLTVVGGTAATLHDMKYRMRQFPRHYHLFQQYEKDDHPDNPWGVTDQVVSPYYTATWYPDASSDAGSSWDPETNDKVMTSRDYLEDIDDNGTSDNTADDVPLFKTVAASGAPDQVVSSYVTENSTQDNFRRKGTYISVRAGFDLGSATDVSYLDGAGRKVAAPDYDFADPAKNTFHRIARVNYLGDIIYYCPGIYLGDRLEPGDVTRLVPTIHPVWNPVLKFNADGVATDAVSVTEAEFWSKASAAGDPDAQYYKICTYVNSLCYWGVWLVNSQENDDLSKRYTVKRNSHYSVTIRSVGSPGDSTEDSVLDKTVDLDSDSEMYASIVFQPWNDVEMGGGI